MYLVFTLCVTWDWDLGTFDVGDAFLTGKPLPTDRPMSQRLFVRPPREGIRDVPQNCLIEILKGVFGFKPAPRLWWIAFGEILMSVGYVPMRTAIAGFLLYDPEGKLCSVLGVHVDDGVWIGAGKFFSSVLQRLRGLLKLRKEEGGRFKLLGREVIYDKPNRMITVNQHQYVAAIRPVYIPAIRRKQLDQKLMPHEKTQYRSLVQQLSWPAKGTLPTITYEVSTLQQLTEVATVQELVTANRLLTRAQERC